MPPTAKSALRVRKKQSGWCYELNKTDTRLRTRFSCHSTLLCSIPCQLLEPIYKWCIISTQRLYLMSVASSTTTITTTGIVFSMFQSLSPSRNHLGQMLAAHFILYIIGSAVLPCDVKKDCWLDELHRKEISVLHHKILLYRQRLRACNVVSIYMYLVNRDYLAFCTVL